MLWVFKQKDEVGEGDLRMDDIRDAYAEYCSGIVEHEEIDSHLSKCTVQVNKKGLIRYNQYVQVVNKRASDSLKQKIRKAFNLFDEVRLTTQAAP